MSRFTNSNPLLNRVKAGIPQGRLQNFDRVEYFERFTQLPLLNAGIAITANTSWEAIGEADFDPATDMLFSANGGITIKTPATTPAANDHAEITPHVDALQSGWAKAGLWGSENQVQFEAQVRPASLAACAVLVGLKEDTTIPADMEVISSDDNACFWFFSDDTSLITAATAANGVGMTGTNWGIVTNNNTVDVVAGTGVTASTSVDVNLQIRIDAGRFPSFYANGVQVWKSTTALKDAVDLIPFVAIMTDTTAVKSLDCRHVRMSRKIA